MGDGGFDPCECIFNHEMAMRRLLSLLRYFWSILMNDFSKKIKGTVLENDFWIFKNSLFKLNSADGNFMMFAMVWMMMAFVMYLLRPQSLRGNRGDAKPQGPQGGGGNPEPPAIS
ncbi:small integral membrane protein 14 [Eurytemora carolleeae]|uniref:small integral membrane protein 14 n=1 Tax=Eurytemora carolleeae TaxID=1294199 RepID=UPI000C78C760|nr:small integral membrane protein 14 [Eurytemora carolleeae]|eukprot:XP_023330188.1 small integral membrane protein 14-like [Eurytemora affinis]